MTSRAMDVIGFVVCAGTTGVWTLFDFQERVYFFLMFLGVVFFIRSHRTRATQDDEPDSIRRIGALLYAQGIQHGEASAQARVTERNSNDLPRVS